MQRGVKEGELKLYEMKQALAGMSQLETLGLGTDDDVSL